MRKIFKTTILVFISVLLNATQAKGQETKEFNWDSIIEAVIQVESKGNPNAYNKNGNCAGILQITPGLVKQCNRWLQAEKSEKRYTLQDRYDVEKSKEMFILVQKYYNKKNDVEKAFRIWNGGPNYNVHKTNKYLAKCLRYYKK